MSVTERPRRRSPIPPPPPSEEELDQDFSNEPSVVTHMLDQMDHLLDASIDKMQSTEQKAARLERAANKRSVPSIQEALRQEAERDPKLAAALNSLRKSRPPKEK